jgi:hypothetical protein
MDCIPAYLWRAFGDPLASAHVAAAWDRVPRSPLQAVADLMLSPLGPALFTALFANGYWVG